MQRPEGPRRIAVVGTGYVGLVVGACFAELGNTVVCLDNDLRRIAMLRRGKLPIFEPNLSEMTSTNYRAGRLSFSEDVADGVRSSDIVFIAVGTPTRGDDSADLSAVRDVAAAIGAALNGPKIVVLKSTVPVQTNEMVSAIIAESSVAKHRVEVVSNPEFLREGSAVADFMHPSRIVIGTINSEAEIIMRDLYAPLDAPIVITDPRTSEMMKYAANAFLATKVSLMNELANICDVLGVDIKAIITGIGLDERIGTTYMGPGIGYGGSCFPKDLRALKRMAEALDYDATLLRAVETVNRKQVSRMLTRIETALGESIEGKKVCVLGLAFKPDTSDVRESPALRLIDLLLRSGASVNAHDPIAGAGARAQCSPDVVFCSGIYRAVTGCDVLVLATEWAEYKRINFRTVRKLMRGNVVFDGRNALDAEKVVAEGLRYVGVGRSKQPDGASREAQPHAQQIIGL